MTVTPAFKINNNALPSPTESRWIEPDDKGINGVGQKLYTPYFSYEISYSRLTQTEFKTILDIWKGHYNSGSATVDLPQYDVASYAFVTYTGVYVDRPINSRGYYENYVSDVKIIIRRINV